MPNKTIYVSEKDESLFEEAKSIAGEALSTVISRALREFIARNTEKEKGMKEISVKIGKENTQQEKRFIGYSLGKWSGFSDDEVWWLEAQIYKTQKGSIAVHLETVSKATLLTNPRLWRASGDYLINVKKSELLVGKSVKELQDKLPKSLFEIVENASQRDENPVEYLDI
jgi:EXLDI family protein